MISGFFDAAGGPYPYVLGAVQIPFVTEDRWVSIPFLVDTGAAHSCIHPLDAIRLLGLSPAVLLNPDHWPKIVTSGGVGGAATYFEVPSRFGFRTGEDSADILDGSAWIAQLTATNQRVPSLLGWDVLKNFRLEIDAAHRTVLLHRV